MYLRNAQFTDRKGAFDPHDADRVKHVRMGVWDLYEEHEPKLANIPGSSRLEKYMDIMECLPYVGRMIRDVLSIPSCAFFLGLYVLCNLGQAFLPALGLWYQGQLLQIMQIAIDTRTVDKDRLFRICVGRILCSVVGHLISTLNTHVVQQPLKTRIRRWYDVRLFRARARLDVPTYETTSVQRQLDEVSASGAFGRGLAQETIEMIVNTLRAMIQICTQVLVLMNVLGNQRDGMLLAGLTLSSQTVHWMSALRVFEPARVWAATTTNEDYVKMEGWKRVMKNVSHRKEVVAGNMEEYASSEYKKASDRVGDSQGDFLEWQRDERMRARTGFWALLEEPLNQLPQIVFTLRAVQYPSSMPVSLASLHLVQEVTNTFVGNIYVLLHSTKSVSEQLSAVRKLYEVHNIPNKIVGGNIPFPEDISKIRFGVALEFRNVSFKYPGADKFALRNISFKLEPGQLCVIVGANGSGKSTILKLITRLYDPEEGQIFVGGYDIRTLKLYDLRQAISVLFQDYTHFPLSIRDNIAIGDPGAAADEAHVRLAARLGGADEFIKTLPDGYDTYLDRPVRDYYSSLPEGTKTLFGREVSYGAVRDAGGMKATGSTALSGGQMQRLAVARTFMRSIVSEDAGVGLLLFDEPSASLDPIAEHDLFERLRELRGNKTMLFSSHRFGNLTRHADVILYMNDSVVVEAGTHDELLRRDGDYAKVWKLQAQAFI